MIHTTASQTYTRFLSTAFEDMQRQRLGTDARAELLRLFGDAAKRVPAYGEFLEAQGIRAERVQTWNDFEAVPLTDKRNYMHTFPLPERCWDGRLDSCDRIAVSSGSTGTPTFWPRAWHHEVDIALRFEQIFRQGFHADRKRTLAIVCFALGNWVGGIYTASCCWHLAHKGYPLLVATPGNKKDEIFRVVRELAPHFEQTVLLGYPPFVKDVIDAGTTEGIDWPRYDVKMVFAGEVFSEEWRNLMAERVGAADICHSFASLYGTADGGVLGNETPITIAIRRFLAEHPSAARELFGEARLPTLVRYDPLSRYFETHDGTLVVSGDNGIPLLRYHIADRGGIIAPDAMAAFLRDWQADLADYGLEQSHSEPALPFAYVFGRADFTVSYYGANIYPENVTVGLEQPDIVAWASGKFVLEAREDGNGDKFLQVTVELLPGIAETTAQTTRAAESIRTELLRLNSEFANYVPSEKQTPRVQLRPFGDPDDFPVGVKHRYSRR